MHVKAQTKRLCFCYSYPHFFAYADVEGSLCYVMSKYSIYFVVFLPYTAPSRPPSNLTLLPLGKDGLELRWKVS